MTTDQMEHTPTPWQVHSQYRDIIVDADGVDVLHAVCDADDVESVASEVLAAVNNRERLVEACRSMLAVLVEPGIQDVDKWKADMRRAVRLGTIAIAKARGE